MARLPSCGGDPSRILSRKQLAAAERLEDTSCGKMDLRGKGINA